jgi:hypothetical protein
VTIARIRIDFSLGIITPSSYDREGLVRWVSTTLPQAELLA